MTEAGFWALAPESRKTRSGLFAKIGNSRLSFRGSNPPGKLSPELTVRKLAVAILIPPTSPAAERAAPVSAPARALARQVRPTLGQKRRSASAAPACSGCPALADKRALPHRDRRPRRHGCT